MVVSKVKLTVTSQFTKQNAVMAFYYSDFVMVNLDTTYPQLNFILRSTRFTVSLNSSSTVLPSKAFLCFSSCDAEPQTQGLTHAKFS